MACMSFQLNLNRDEKIFDEMSSQQVFVSLHNAVGPSISISPVVSGYHCLSALLICSLMDQPYRQPHSHMATLHATIGDVSQLSLEWGGWGCEVSCGGHHRPRGKTTMGSALDGAVFDIAQILAYLVHNMSRSQLYLGFGHSVWLPSFFGQ